MMEYTVDFIILKENGEYLCKSRIPKKFRDNHLVAQSFSVRSQAEATMKVMRLKGKVIKRSCRMEV